MARANFVKKARKDNPAVSKGESYWWWKFPFGGKHYSSSQPKRSQLTQSSFQATLWDIEDDFEFDRENLESSVEDLTSQLEDLRDGCQNNLDNMPEHLQDTSDAGCTLTERIEQLDEWIQNLEAIDLEPELPEEDDIDPEMLDEERETLMDQAKEEAVEAKVQELEDCNPF
jgi:hypothetical protein